MNEENKIPKFVTDLTNYLIAIRNLSEVYVKNMSITVGQFLEFINIHKFKNKYNSIKDITLNDVRSLTNSDIYSFIYFLAESQYKINSRVVKIEHLRTFFNYLFTIKHTIFTEPFKKINSERKIEKKLPNYLSLDEAKKMIEVYANSIDEIEIRDNAILHLFLNSGLRLAELKNLSIDDLDLKDNKFSIIGKGNKERTGYINDITRKALDEYLKVRDKLNPKTKTLFVSRYGLKMSSTGIEKIVKRAYEKAEIDDVDYCVHTLRHTCATLLYRNGVDIRTIQEILGHVQIDTTEIYTHLHDQEVMDAMLDHPLSQFKVANAEAFCA
ncbi:MAG: tyrosine-type recombinase/integrase [Clostridia bacterium]